MAKTDEIPTFEGFSSSTGDIDIPAFDTQIPSFEGLDLPTESTSILDPINNVTQQNYFDIGGSKYEVDRNNEKYNNFIDADEINLQNPFTVLTAKRYELSRKVLLKQQIAERYLSRRFGKGEKILTKAEKENYKNLTLESTEGVMMRQHIDGITSFLKKIPQSMKDSFNEGLLDSSLDNVERSEKFKAWYTDLQKIKFTSKEKNMLREFMPNLADGLFGYKIASFLKEREESQRAREEAAPEKKAAVQSFLFGPSRFAYEETPQEKMTQREKAFMSFLENQYSKKLISEGRMQDLQKIFNEGGIFESGSYKELVSKYKKSYDNVLNRSTLSFAKGFTSGMISRNEELKAYDDILYAMGEITSPQAGVYENLLETVGGLSASIIMSKMTGAGLSKLGKALEGMKKVNSAQGAAKAVNSMNKYLFATDKYRLKEIIPNMSNISKRLVANGLGWTTMNNVRSAIGQLNSGVRRVDSRFGEGFVSNMMYEVPLLFQNYLLAILGIVSVSMIENINDMKNGDFNGFYQGVGGFIFMDSFYRLSKSKLRLSLKPLTEKGSTTLLTSATKSILKNTLKVNPDGSMSRYNPKSSEDIAIAQKEAKRAIGDIFGVKKEEFKNSIEKWFSLNSEKRLNISLQKIITDRAQGLYANASRTGKPISQKQALESARQQIKKEMDLVIDLKNKASRNIESFAKEIDGMEIKELHNRSFGNLKKALGPDVLAFIEKEIGGVAPSSSPSDIGTHILYNGAKMRIESSIGTLFNKVKSKIPKDSKYDETGLLDFVEKAINNKIGRVSGKTSAIKVNDLDLVNRKQNFDNREVLLLRLKNPERLHKYVQRLGEIFGQNKEYAKKYNPRLLKTSKGKDLLIVVNKFSGKKHKNELSDLSNLIRTGLKKKLLNTEFLINVNGDIPYFFNNTIHKFRKFNDLAQTVHRMIYEGTKKANVSSEKFLRKAGWGGTRRRELYGNLNIIAKNMNDLFVEQSDLDRLLRLFDFETLNTDQVINKMLRNKKAMKLLENEVDSFMRQGVAVKSGNYYEDLSEAMNTAKIKAKEGIDELSKIENETSLRKKIEEAGLKDVVGEGDFPAVRQRVAEIKTELESLQSFSKKFSPTLDKVLIDLAESDPAYRRDLYTLAGAQQINEQTLLNSTMKFLFNKVVKPITKIDHKIAENAAAKPYYAHPNKYFRGLFKSMEISLHRNQYIFEKMISDFMPEFKKYKDFSSPFFLKFFELPDEYLTAIAKTGPSIVQGSELRARKIMELFPEEAKTKNGRFYIFKLIDTIDNLQKNNPEKFRDLLRVRGKYRLFSRSFAELPKHLFPTDPGNPRFREKNELMQIPILKAYNSEEYFRKLSADIKTKINTQPNILNQNLESISLYRKVNEAITGLFEKKEYRFEIKDINNDDLASLFSSQNKYPGTEISWKDSVSMQLKLYEEYQKLLENNNFRSGRAKIIQAIFEGTPYSDRNKSFLNSTLKHGKQKEKIINWVTDADNTPKKISPEEINRLNDLLKIKKSINKMKSLDSDHVYHQILKEPNIGGLVDKNDLMSVQPKALQLPRFFDNIDKLMENDLNFETNPVNLLKTKAGYFFQKAQWFNFFEKLKDTNFLIYQDDISKLSMSKIDAAISSAFERKNNIAQTIKLNEARISNKQISEVELKDLRRKIDEDIELISAKSLSEKEQLDLKKRIDENTRLITNPKISTAKAKQIRSENLSLKKKLVDIETTKGSLQNVKDSYVEIDSKLAKQEFFDLPPEKGSGWLQRDVYDSLSEMRNIMSRNKNLAWALYDRFANFMKLRRFYLPTKIGVNDILQTMMSGNIDAFAEIPKAVKALRQGLDSELYKQTLFYNGFNELAGNPFKAAQEFRSTVIEAGKKVNIKDPDVKKFLLTIKERYPEYFSKAKTLKQVSAKVVSIGLADPFYKTQNKVAWSFDKVMRMAMVSKLKKTGMSWQDSVERMGLFLSDYDRLPTKTRRILNRVFFTGTYQSQMLRLQKEILTKAHRNPAMFKAFIGFMTTRMLMEFMAAKMGYTSEGKRNKLFNFAMLKAGYRFFKVEPTAEESKVKVMAVSLPPYVADKYIINKGKMINRSLHPVLLFLNTVFTGKERIGGRKIAYSSDTMRERAIKWGLNLLDYFYPFVKDGYETVNDLVKGEDSLEIYEHLMEFIGVANFYILNDQKKELERQKEELINNYYDTKNAESKLRLFNSKLGKINKMNTDLQGIRGVQNKEQRDYLLRKYLDQTVTKKEIRKEIKGSQ